MAAKGHILLEGGAEFGGMMSEPDRQAVMLAGGPDAPIRIIPAAAAPDHNHERAGQKGVRWFRQLGAKDVITLPLIDRNSAEKPEIVQALKDARLIYLLGGFTHHLAQTLIHTAAWTAVLSAYQAGAVVAGSSAGAMVLCEYYYRHASKTTVKGLNLLPGTCVIPHHDTFGKNWITQLTRWLPDITLIGIDEETGVIDSGSNKRWGVYGKGSVSIYRGAQESRRYVVPGEEFLIGE